VLVEGRLGVNSETGPLQLALVHQPGYEHRHTIPWNKDAFLFDDILDVEEARPEHKEFTRLLSTHGVHVLYLLDLLKDVCSEVSAFSALVREILPTPIVKDPELSKIKPIDLIQGLPSHHEHDSPAAFAPLPNLYFVRDAMFCVPGAIVLASPARAARRRETTLLKSILKHHPLFEGVKVCSDIFASPEARIEGGDILVPDPATVLVGIGERTNERGAQLLTEFLFTHTSVSKVAKIYNPPRRDFMHLDAVLCFVDRGRILTLPYLWDRPDLYAEIASRCRRQSARLGEPYSGPLPEAFSQSCQLEVIEKASDTPRKYNNVLRGLDEEGIIEIGGTIYVGGPQQHYTTPEQHIVEGLREQWNDAANVLALKPGQVVAYARNDRTFRALEEEGIEVVALAGGELVRGRGGPRSMVSPLARR
jgi:arginine deiminase